MKGEINQAKVDLIVYDGIKEGLKSLGIGILVICAFIAAVAWMFAPVFVLPYVMKIDVGATIMVLIPWAVCWLAIYIWISNVAENISRNLRAARWEAKKAEQIKKMREQGLRATEIVKRAQSGKK